MGLTPAQRKEKVLKLKEEHQDYFDTITHDHLLYIPKMAYRPSGKDELHVSFFPSELEKEADVYTEFVSIDYDSEDPKRNLYLSDIVNKLDEINQSLITLTKVINKLIK